MDFGTALRAHLDAVRTRDLEAFAATVDGDCAVVLLDGRVVDGRDAVLELHRDWFADPDWSIEFSPVKTVVRDGLGVALVAVDYTDVDGRGAPVALHYLLSLTFAPAQEGWLLVHDQNTSSAGA